MEYNSFITGLCLNMYFKLLNVLVYVINIVKVVFA